ncbi:MAG: hypothetical protein ACKVTZ_19985 [Bacteroidia bacterium]
METELIASFSIQTPFNKKWEAYQANLSFGIAIICTLSAAILGKVVACATLVALTVALFLFSLHTLIGAKYSYASIYLSMIIPLGIGAFLFHVPDMMAVIAMSFGLSFLIAGIILKISFPLKKYQEATLLCYDDKFIIKENYTQPKFPLEAWVMRFLLPEEITIELTYSDLSRIRVYYILGKSTRRGEIEKSKFELNFSYTYPLNSIYLKGDEAARKHKLKRTYLEKTAIEIPKEQVIVDMQRLLRHLYTTDIEMIEENSRGERTKLLHPLPNVSVQKIDKKYEDLIDEIGRKED